MSLMIGSELNFKWPTEVFGEWQELNKNSTMMALTIRLIAFMVRFLVKSFAHLMFLYSIGYLVQMIQFAEQFENAQIVVPVARQLSWSHFICMIRIFS
jgi:hypothetical protein